MYDFEKFRWGRSLQVKDVIRELSKEDPNKYFTVCGDTNCYFHVGENVVTIDNEDLFECYPDHLTNKDFNYKRIISEDRAVEMLKIITEHLAMDAGVEETSNQLRDIGFSDDEINVLIYGGDN